MAGGRFRVRLCQGRWCDPGTGRHGARQRGEAPGALFACASSIILMRQKHGNVKMLMDVIAGKGGQALD